MTDVVFPQVSDDDSAEGVVATWFAAEGESVSEGDLIAEVAVDKVNMEITAPAGGVLQQVVEEGSVVRQGAVIAKIR
jgi:pyruvate/2-oxoglutarate dehydrogenase complex dihydrolipoamide acyltransferase (E2) component